jgi:epoxyqueuosine reductase
MRPGKVAVVASCAACRVFLPAVRMTHHEHTRMNTRGESPSSAAAAAAGADIAAVGSGPAGPVAILAELRTAAGRLGFARLGVAPAVPPPRQDLVRRWIDRGFAGAVGEWLERQLPLRADPAHLLTGVRSVVMLATDHATTAPHGDAADPGDAAEAGDLAGAGRGRVARYAWGGDYHDLLRARVNELSAWLEARVPGCRTRGVVDSAPLAEREFAWLAGLGWFGKNTMLIDPNAGSYFLLTALLTDLELPTDAPLEVDHCGSCTACLDACPTDAFVAPRLLDASRCISGLSIEDHGPIGAELRGRMGAWVFGCDVCQEVCPWNRHAPGSAEPSLQPRPTAAGEPPGTLPLAELLRLDEAGFRRRFRGTPLLRAKRRGLLRSAAIALGNAPDPAAFEPLAAALADAEEVVRGAAAWALGCWSRVGGPLGTWSRERLTTRLAVEADAEVRREIERALGRTASESE